MKAYGSTSIKLQEFRLHLERIPIKGQYGSSYRAVVVDADDMATISNFFQVSSVDQESRPTQHESLPSSLFVKCPSIDLKPKQQASFVDGEFANGTAINYAASRVDPCVTPNFRISQMIGKGTLDCPNLEIDKRPCLVYEHVDGTPLNSKIYRKQVNVTAAAFLRFSWSFARSVQLIHNQGIVHTFMVPRNIIWSGPEGGGVESLMGNFTLVGFGYARLIDAAGKVSLPARETDEDNWFRAPECRRPPRYAALGYPADIYSIGAILYSLLLPFGSRGLDVLKKPIADTRVLKREIAKAICEAQKNLIQENENILKIIDSCLRFDAESRYSCVEELIEAIEIALFANPETKGSAAKKGGVRGSVSKADAVATGEKTRDAHGKKDLRSLSREKSSFKQLEERSAEEHGDVCRRLNNGHFEVYGHRDRIITSLCWLLAGARKGDEYCTMTLPDYWTDTNLGSLGRFLIMNKHMARRGVMIKRLFLVSCDFHSLPEEEQVVLEEQLRIVKYLEEERVSTLPDVKVLEVEKERIAAFELNCELVAFLGRAHGSEEDGFICLNFFSTAREAWMNGKVNVRRTIRKVRYWDPRKLRREVHFKDSKKGFEDLLRDAQPLEKYIHHSADVIDNTKVDLGELIGAARRSENS